MDELRVLFNFLLELLNEGKYPQLKEELNSQNPVNIAEFLEEYLTSEKQLFVFKLLTKDLAADVFSYIDSDTQEHITKSITDDEIRNIVNEMFLDDAVDFLSEMPANLVTKVLKNTDEKKRKQINEFLNYPENSAGSLMTIEYVQFNENMNVEQSMKLLRKTGLDKETIYTCYIVDSSKVLVGIVDLRTLILSEDEKKISDIMEEKIVSVNTLDDQEEVAYLFKKYNWMSLPVVDKENRLVGIITVDDIVDVIEQENTEDFEKMAALLPADEEYLKTSVFELSKNRIVWLLVLMVSGTFSSAIINKYNEILSSAVVLASFIPILMDTGGNAGSQASTLIIRGMALGEIEIKDVFKVIWKELRVGLLSGFVLAVVNFIRLMFIDKDAVNVNITVSITIVLVVVAAKTIGCVLPMFAKKMHFDPAIMAGPLITTIVDSIALVIFFQLARIFVL